MQYDLFFSGNIFIKRFFIGLLIFAHYFGIIGMIIATPCIALLKVIFKFIVKKYNLFKDDEVLLKEVLKDD